MWPLSGHLLAHELAKVLEDCHYHAGNGGNKHENPHEKAGAKGALIVFSVGQSPRG
jgi:hypothetical protein